MSVEEAVLNLSLPARPEAASAARQALAALNGSLHLISTARLADAQLLVTELVTNAVRHGDTETVGLEAYATQGTLRVVVANAGGRFESRGEESRAPDRAGGWGLRIVAALAHRWGVAEHGEDVKVWFEVDRPQREAPLVPTEPAPPPDHL
jgi:anti-sigma regulatory factor (Ser/Thr protein kinase)